MTPWSENNHCINSNMYSTNTWNNNTFSITN